MTRAAAVRIRRFHAGEEDALLAVYRSAIHLLARRDYTEEQVHAWAPLDMDRALWAARIRGINPFVAERHDQPVGYADLQSSGYIDHFFVSGHHARAGIGSALMRHLLREAADRALSEMTADVSRTAQPFFERSGFQVVEQRFPERRGIVIPNAFMRRTLDAEQRQTILRAL